MGRLTKAHEALEAKGKKSGWVDHEIERYKMVRGAIRKTGNLDATLTVADACEHLDAKIKQREETPRHQDRSWQPRDSYILETMRKKIVDPLLTAAMLTEQAQDAIEVSERDDDPPKKSGAKA